MLIQILNKIRIVYKISNYKGYNAYHQMCGILSGEIFKGERVQLFIKGLQLVIYIHGGTALIPVRRRCPSISKIKNIVYCVGNYYYQLDTFIFTVINDIVLLWCKHIYCTHSNNIYLILQTILLNENKTSVQISGQRTDIK